jgi:general secretion pathway protein D
VSPIIPRRIKTLITSVACCALATACTPKPSPLAPVASPKAIVSAPTDTSPLPTQDSRLTSTTILGGTAPLPPRTTIRSGPASGDISLNFPNVDVEAAAKAILGDMLKLPFTIAPGLTSKISVMTTQPIARAAILQLFEDAVKQANLAMVWNGSAYAIMPIDQARAQAVPTSANSTGFGSETVQLNFVSAEEMRKLLAPILPGVVSRTEGSLNILTLAGTTGQRANARDLLKQFDVNWLRNMSFGLYVPKRTDSRLIVPELDKLLNSEGAPTKGLVRLISMEQLNGILAISTQRQYLEDVTRWIDVLDREGTNNEKRLFVYRVQNGRSNDLAKVINRAFGGSSGGNEPTPTQRDPFASGTPQVTSAADNRGANDSDFSNRRNSSRDQDTSQRSSGSNTLAANVTSDDANNAILIYGTPKEFSVIEDALRKLDILPFQVMIEAAITEVTLNDNLRYGLQWSFKEGETTTTLTDRLPVTASQTLAFVYSNNSSINATLTALESLTNINVVSAPKLLVLNNQTASLQVGNQVPVATGSSVSTQTPDAPIVNSIEYRDTGVILKITPRVNSSGLVLLDVAQEVSDVTANTSSSINSPTISTRRIASSIAIQDGQVIALGGLIQDNKTRGKGGVPYLSRIPVFGSLFGTHVNSGSRTELLILLRPRVIRTVDDGDALTKELREKLRSTDPLSGYGPLP